MQRRLLPLLVLLPACQGATDLALPRVVASELSAPARLVRELAVELDRSAPVVVEYAAAGAPPLRIHSPAARTHSLHLARLRPATTYQYRIEGTMEGGSFHTDPLPEDLEALRFVASGASTLPLVLLHVSTPDGFRGYVVVDDSGTVVWYHRTREFPYGMTRRANGNFVFLDGGRGLVEVTPGGRVVAELPQDLETREMHHDAVATPSNTVLAIAFDTRPWNGRLLKGEAIWEWWPETGHLEKRWSSWDHLSPELDRGPRFGLEWMHANSLSVGPRGNVLMSVHYFNQVISIAPGWGGIEWRLGGVNATIGLAEEDRFSGQHTAVEVAQGRVVLFDNALERGGSSRALELELDGSEARRAWEWRSSPENFSAFVSSARRLANGNTLVAFGMGDGIAGSAGGTEVYEVAPDGQPTWHLRVEGPSVMFRAEPLRSIAGEGH